MRGWQTLVRSCARAIQRAKTGVALAPLVGAWLFSTTTHAESSAPLLCIVRGATPMPVNLAIYDQPNAGRPIARFTGAHTALAAVSFPASSSGRIGIETSTGGGGGFRIKGHIPATRLPIYTLQKIPVVVGHVWIGEKQEVTFQSASTSGLKVKKPLNPPLSGSFVGGAVCAAFTLSPGAPPGFNVPGHARGYRVTSESIELYAAPDGRVITTLSRNPSSPAILLWSNERREAWVRVEYHGEIVVDAWAKASDLSALPPGETMDQLAGPSYRRSGPKLSVPGSPQLVRTSKQVSLRLAARDSDTVIGSIEPDTETYVLDVVAGWASVLPKTLNVQPHGEDQFWVKASELGL